MENKEKIYANFWLRQLSHCIDMGIGWLISLLILLSAASSTTIPSLLTALLNAFIINIFIGTGMSFILAYFDTKFGGSPGKLLTGLTIVNEENKFISYWRAWFRRVIGNMVSSTLFWLGYIWIFVDKDKRGWHDLISGTWVTVKNKSQYALGLIALLVLIFSNIFIISQIAKTVKERMPLYEQTFEDIKDEFNSTDTTLRASPENNNFKGLPTITPQVNLNLDSSRELN
jgi:uncharacterized RDD family membrane protein YckC